MAVSGQSRAAANKAIRQEALRQKLAAGGHIQRVVEIASQLQDLKTELEALEVTRLKHSADLQLKLVDKYLPSLKQVELSEAEGLGELTDDELNSKIKAFLAAG